MPGSDAKGRLATYHAKRDFAVTSEPRGEMAEAGKTLSFVIQKHAATSLHYDFRLELDGVLISWAVPKGPSLDPADKRMAIHVEDHPLSYGSFEGTIPPKQYGAGTVIVWDNGTWQPIGDPQQGLASGKLAFRLDGQKLQGTWELIKIAKGGERQEPWLLFKKRDEFARPKADFDVVTALPDSVIRKPLRTAAPGKPGTRRSKSDPGVEAAFPDRITPQLATLATGVPSQGQWIYEVKFDGYRLLARIQDGEVTLFTRGGHDWSAKMPELVKSIGALKIDSAWLDGEIVVLGENGAPNFNLLQKAFDRKAPAADIRYFLFDLLYLDGKDLRDAPLIERRERLKQLLDEHESAHLQFSADFDTNPATALASASRMGLEGIIAKRADSVYRSRRTDSWLKLKCKQRQEFVVCGYVDRTDGSPQVGSLLLGVYDDNGDLVSAGSVGTGWDSAQATALKRKLSKLEVEAPAFAAGATKPGRWSKRVQGSEKWLKPTLVAEVEFAEWTPDGNVRHASYVGLRTDKPATAIIRETAVLPDEIGDGDDAATATSGIKVSHGERVIDASTGLTKLQLVRYYEHIADRILPHLKGRPVAFVRGPAGVAGQQFFQKHDEQHSIPGVKQLSPDLWPEHPALIEVASAAALAQCAQMNVIEFHTWNAMAKAITKPDRMIFDLDPGEGTQWPQIIEAALLVREILVHLGLQSWLKTSGGKGLHVVVPITPRLDYETVKEFSKAVVQHLAKTIPSRFVAKSGASNRVGKLFVDYLRNGFGATTATAFSARARPGLGVSMPVSWDDLPSLKGGDQWTIVTATDHLSFESADPWAEYWSVKQTLTKGMKTLGVAGPAK